MTSGLNELTSLPIPLTAPAGLRARFARGVRWNLVASVAGQGSTYLLTIFLARILTRHAFGEYAIIQNTLLTASMLAQLGTGVTATKYVAEFRLSDKQRAGRILGLCLIVSTATSILLSLGLIAAAHPISTHLLAEPGLAPSLMIGAGILIFFGMNAAQMGALAGLESYKTMAWAAGISGVLSVSLASVAADFWGLNGALLGLLAATALQWAIFHLALRLQLRAHDIRITLVGVSSERSILLRFALPAAASGLFSMPALWFASTILVRQPNGYPQMALYSAAATTKVLMLFVPNIVNSVGTSLLNNQRGAGAAARYRKVFWANLAATTAAVLVGAIALALFSGSLLAPFGPTFVEARPILLILILGGVLEAVMSAIYQIIQAHEKMLFSLLFIAIPRDLLIVVLAWYLVPSMGAKGLAYAYLVAWTFASFVYTIGAYRIGLEPVTLSHKT